MTTADVARFRVASPRPPSKVPIQLQRKGSTVTMRWGPSKGAERYAIALLPSRGRDVSAFLPARCRGIRVTGVGREVTLKASVVGIRYDQVRGKVARATLRASKRGGGVSGRSLPGRRCTVR